MEDDLYRPYSVLTRDELKEKMKKEIDELSEIFLLSRSDATVLLSIFGWNLDLVSERLSEDEDKLLTESGLKTLSVDSSQKSSDSYCVEFANDVDDDLISTPFCSHKFSKKYWRKYLENALEKNQTSGISCPDPVCVAAVGPDTIKILPTEDETIYERYLLRSYLEGKHLIKLCPAPNCNYAIEFHEDDGDDEYGLNVVCLCGHTFCWRCKLESHRPVTCNNASDWLSRDMNNSKEESLSLSRIQTNTERCLECLSPVALERGKFSSSHLSGEFCWKCLQPKKDYLKLEEAEPEISCEDEDLWNAAEIAMEKAKSDLQHFEKSIIENPSILTQPEIKLLREGLMLVVQCRQVIKWSCVYDYFHTEYEASKKEYLHFLQGKATDVLESYSESLDEGIGRAFTEASFDKCNLIRGMLNIETSNIGNYFYHFIKTLQDGLVEVQVQSYDKFSPYWPCDRCTYGNTWFDRTCKICCDPTASPVY